VEKALAHDDAVSYGLHVEAHFIIKKMRFELFPQFAFLENKMDVLDGTPTR
jgi:hypothetical protein